MDLLEHKCPYGMKFQSGVLDATLKEADDSEKVQNVQFHDQHHPYAYNMSSPMDMTRGYNDTHDAELGNFLCRPVKVYEGTWNVGSSYFDDLNPWSAFLEQKKVINRITNFKLLRCNLRVKFVINGNGFHYGRILVSYLPLHSIDEMSTNSSLIVQDLVAASQRPHIFLDPTTSTGGELKLPFFSFANSLNVPLSTWQSMGSLNIRSINELTHANNATDTVSISAFVWAEDVVLSGLTDVNPATLVPQSGEVDEANTKGIVSGPATTVSKVATALSDVPVISPYAKATAKVSGAVASVAKSLGYSRPSVTADPEPFKPVANSNLANTTVVDQFSKLTVDDKQELSIDPVIAGVDSHDPLLISAIAQRESYLTTFNWAVSDNIDKALWYCRITPNLYARDPGLGIHLPAMAAAALPFKYWTGSIRFRFQIVCSSFHKGRLRLVYDATHGRDDTAAPPDFNTTYNQVIDIADKQDASFEIGYSQNRSYLECYKPGKDNEALMYNTDGFSFVNFDARDNGVITLYVLNTLTTPNSTSINDIQVNVFVSAGDDFEVAVPDDHFQNLVYTPQSGVIISESTSTSEPSAPAQSEYIRMGPPQASNQNLNDVYFGETVRSLRPLLKRYNLHSTTGFSPDPNFALKSGRYCSFPFLRGNQTDAVHTTASGASYNYCNTVLLQYIAAMFAGQRGSVRWKMLARSGYDATYPPVIQVQRAPIEGSQYYYYITTVNTATESAAASTVLVNSIANAGMPSQFAPLSGVRGAMNQHGVVNYNAEFECPYYSPLRFSPARLKNYTGQSRYQENFDFKIIGNSNTYSAWDMWVAAGEDFQVYFFLGQPRLYYEPFAPGPPIN